MKKALILTVIAILALGVMAMAKHVSGTSAGASITTTVNATIEVYQWFDYSISTTGTQVIADDATYTLELADVGVSSNGDLNITYSFATPVVASGETYYYGESDSGSVTPGTAFTVTPSTDPNNLTDVSLYVETNVPYDLAATTMTCSIDVKIAATQTF